MNVVFDPTPEMKNEKETQTTFDDDDDDWYTHFKRRSLYLLKRPNK